MSTLTFVGDEGGGRGERVGMVVDRGKQPYAKSSKTVLLSFMSKGMTSSFVYRAIFLQHLHMEFVS